MPKPSIGQADWGHALNAHLDELSASIADRAPNSALASKADASALTAKQDKAQLDADVAAKVPDQGSAIGAALSATIATATSGKVSKSSLPFNVKDYGATGDGSADDTAAIQAAINAARGAAASGSPTTSTEASAQVYLPPGLYKITSPLLFKGMRGINFVGSGKRVTAIMVDASIASALALEGIAYGRVADFSIVGNGLTKTVNAAISWDWTPALTTGSSYHVEFERIQISDLKFKYGIAAGESSANYDVSAGTFRSISIDGGWTLGSTDTNWYQAGIRVGSNAGGNILNHHIYGSRIHQVKNAVQVNEVNEVNVINTEASYVDNYVYKQGHGVLNIDGCRVEEAYRLVDTLGGAGYASSLTASNVFWSGITSARPDAYYIRWNYGGTVLLQNVYIQPQASTIRISCNSTKPVSVILDGYAMPGDFEEGAVVAIGATQVHVATRGFYYLAADSSISSRRPDRRWAIGTDSDLLLGTETGTTSAWLTMQAPTASGGARGVRFKKAGTQEWLLYQSGAGTDLFLRDSLNSVNHAVFSQAAGTAGITTFAGRVRAGAEIRTGAVATGSRPTASSVGAGAMIYDTTLSKPIWSDGTTWRDAMGTAV